MTELGTTSYTRLLYFLVVVSLTGKEIAGQSNTAPSLIGACQNGFVKAGSACIKFINNRVLDWKGAKRECAALSASLIRFDTSDDIVSFSALARTQPVDGWWSDLTSQGHSQVWTWGTNQQVTDGAVAWNQEPDDIKHAENCVAIDYLGESSDQMCSKPLGYICEKPAVGDGCDVGLKLIGNSCYFLSDTTDPSQLATWQQAIQKCQQIPVNLTNTKLTLVSLESAQKYGDVSQQLVSTANYKTYRWWTSLNDRAAEGHYKWGNSVAADTSVIVWERLPNSLRQNEECSIVHSNGNISTSFCSIDNYFACKYHSTASHGYVQQELGCPDIWIRAGQKCYFFNTNTSMTHDDAATFCTSRKARLLKTENLDEKRWIALKTDRLLQSNFWSGLKRNPQDTSKWLWQDGSQPQMTLIDWSKEPNNMRGENCAFITHSGEYIDASCFSRMAFFCEMQTEDAACPTNWITRSLSDGTTCYYISNTTDAALATWAESREICRKLSGVDESSLLAVNDATEKTFINNHLKALPNTPVGWWTDLTDAQHEGVWTYYDTWNRAPQPGFLDWAQEPNNVGGKENCAVMYYGGQYNDISCKSHANVACEMPAVLFHPETGKSGSGASSPPFFISLIPVAIFWIAKFNFNRP